MCFIKKCIEDILATKTMNLPKQNLCFNNAIQAKKKKPLLLDVARKRSIKKPDIVFVKALELQQYRHETETQSNTTDTKGTWQEIHNILDFKGNKHAAMSTAVSQPDKLNHFYAHFKALSL